MKFCCDTMQRYVDEHNLFYDESIREVTFYIKSNDKTGYQPEYYRSPCIYCPYCGAKQPQSLEFERDDALEEALGKDYNDIEDDEIPEEFKSDKWWKKRHLDDPKVLEEWRKKHT
jgi:hypothetical protein